MFKRVFLFLFSIFCLLVSAAELPIVSDGTARAVIVRGNKGRACEMAVRELHKSILECSGISLQIVDIGKMSTIAPDMTRLIVGNCEYATAAGFGHEKMAIEENIVVVKGRDIFFNGRNWDEPGLRVYGAPQPPLKDIDIRRFCPAELFAVTEFMDRILGVRILWPGERGRYYPQHTSISLPDNYVFRTRPEYDSRHPWYRPGEDEIEVTEYLLMHRQTTRVPLAFQDQVYWFWNKYHKNHPEIFAKNPKGEIAYWQKPIFAKFCMSNPATADFLMERWRDAGRPDITPILAPTDGRGDCCCAGCRQLDPPEIQAASAEDIWLGRVSLSIRYIDFWNAMLARMQKENPNARACILGYDAYRFFPEGKKLIPGFLVNIVPEFNIFDKNELDVWRSWRNSGAKLYLRPNWQHLGVCLPCWPLKPMENYIRMAQADGMGGYGLDRIMKNWAIDGFLNYAYIRLLNRTDLTMEDIKLEFASAFGKGAPEIINYINYWEQYTYRIFGSQNGEFTDGLGDGLLSQAIRQNRWIRNAQIFWMVDTWQLLYPIDVIDEGGKFLNRAAALIGDSDPEALAKVQFLRGGLDYVRQCTVCMNLHWKKPAGRSAEFMAERRRLLALRERLDAIGAISWIQTTYMEFDMRMRTIPTTPTGSWAPLPQNYQDPRTFQ